MANSTSLNPSYSFSEELQKHLYGRLLLLDEISFPEELLSDHIKNGYISTMPGIKQIESQHHCSRCGNNDHAMFYRFPCSCCGKKCAYCRACIMMGRISECSKLYFWSGPGFSFEILTEVMAWAGSLSEGQKIASERVIDAVNNNEELLVWAVCGAGKTEVLFEGVEAALRSGKRVCIATPRTDVVLELAPRLKSAFPQIEVAALYGGSDDRHLLAPLTVTTTHQLFRFHNAFDTIIIDEVDAFPYSMDSSLQFAVRKAKKNISIIIYLTATPSKEMQADYENQKLIGVTIPARYHRHPIPAPLMKWCGNWKREFERNRIPNVIADWVSLRLQLKTPFLLFFSSIKVMEQALSLLQSLDNELQSVHSQDPERKEKVTALREGRISGLLTTTILERGVTIPKLDVAVIGSEHPVFSESALVQIAGRVGRSEKNPEGDITFFHYGKSNNMIRAIGHIGRMNKEAEKRGLLDV
ncbi:DEAD/DEAH box helicase [Bacillus sp. CECT 9360]|uniref:DEAD/DEAH box helicase n=1 Tax=Bacillus sp. CECT 9360 TaxID=2845821 RepID=UPI001E380B00|nr:DEAD/DEAH box helicase [Bacillus sp. CECT 9360]CAH0344859.1 ComF operon protein 1 [Bacillus sp. CECT 9360]